MRVEPPRLGSKRDRTLNLVCVFYGQTFVDGKEGKVCAW